LFVTFWADRSLSGVDADPALFAVATALSLLIFVGAVHRFAFAPFAAFCVDRQLPFPSMLDYAAGPMALHRGALLLRLAGLALVASSGALVFSGFGTLVTAPWALIAAAHLYLRMWPPAAPPL
ncbi:MAG: hypothetical protein AAGE94_22170, partial [Acidobacteriota bacterium]